MISWFGLPGLDRNSTETVIVNSFSYNCYLNFYVYASMQEVVEVEEDGTWWVLQEPITADTATVSVAAPEDTGPSDAPTDNSHANVTN